MFEDENMVTLEHKYVFIVLECHKHKKHERIHGVYTSRDIANSKALKVSSKNPDHGYICVLKKTIEGPTKRPLFSYDAFRYSQLNLNCNAMI